MPNFAHISDDDLERLILGTITDEAELAPLEEHLLVCDECIARGGGTLQFVETMRATLKRIRGRRSKPVVSAPVRPGRSGRRRERRRSGWRSDTQGRLCRRAGVDRPL